MQSRDQLLRIFGWLIIGGIACIDEPVMPPKSSPLPARVAVSPIFHRPQTAGPCLGRVDGPDGQPLAPTDSLADGDSLTIYPCPPGVQRGAQVAEP